MDNPIFVKLKDQKKSYHYITGQIDVEMKDFDQRLPFGGVSC